MSAGLILSSGIQARYAPMPRSRAMALLRYSKLCRPAKSTAAMIQDWVSETWRAPCLWRPLPASLAGGAGARPDHPINGHPPSHAKPSIVQHIVGTRVAVASRYRAAILIFDESNREGN